MLKISTKRTKKWVSSTGCLLRPPPYSFPSCPNLTPLLPSSPPSVPFSASPCPHCLSPWCVSSTALPPGNVLPDSSPYRTAVSSACWVHRNPTGKTRAVSHFKIQIPHDLQWSPHTSRKLGQNSVSSRLHVALRARGERAHNWNTEMTKLLYVTIFSMRLFKKAIITISSFLVEPTEWTLVALGVEGWEAAQFLSHPYLPMTHETLCDSQAGWLVSFPTSWHMVGSGLGTRLRQG